MKIPYTVTIDPCDVARITPENLLAYALRSGWEVLREWERYTVVHSEFPVSAPIFLTIPNKRESFDDYAYWNEVRSLVSAWCEIEQRDPRDIVRDIVCPVNLTAEQRAYLESARDLLYATEDGNVYLNRFVASGVSIAIGDSLVALGLAQRWRERVDFVVYRLTIAGCELLGIPIERELLEAAR